MRAVVAVGGQYWSTTTHAVVTAERPAALQSVVSQLASRRVASRCILYDEIVARITTILRRGGSIGEGEGLRGFKPLELKQYN